MQTKSVSGKKLEHFRAIANVLSSKHDIRVQFRGQECHTDGKIITLPVIPDDAPAEFIDVMGGMLDHETGHVVHTQFDDLKKEFTNKKGKELDPSKSYRKHLWNALEDPRIETKLSAGWSGCGLNIESTHVWLQEKTKENWGEMHPFSKFATIIGKAARAQLSGGCAAEFMGWVRDNDPDTYKLYEQCADLVKKMGTFDVSEMVDAKGTARTMDLAKKIMARMGITDPDLPEMPQEEHRGGGNGEQGEDEEEGSQGQGGGIGDEEGEGDGQGDGSGKKSGNAKGDKGKDGKDGGKGNDLAVDDQSWDNIIKETSANHFVEEYAKIVHKDSDQYLPYTTERDVFLVGTPGSKVSYMTFLRHTEQVVNPIRRKLFMLLKAKDRIFYENNKRRGSLNRRAVHKLGLPKGAGDSATKVFRKKHERPALNTAVQLCIDLSGSMSGGRIKNAVKTASILGEVMDRLEIPFEVIGHTTTNDDVYWLYENLPHDQQKMYSRFDAVKFVTFKAYSETWKMVRHRLDPSHVRAENHNCDVDAFRYCIHRLSERPEARKVMFDIKDGFPQGTIGGKNQEWNYHLKKEVAEAIKVGFEVVGVGIQCDCVKQFYDDYIIVDNISDLAGVCLNKLSSILRKGTY